jgi:integrase
MTVTTGLGSEVDKFLNAVSPTEDIANGKLGSSAKSYKPGFIWFQRFLSEQALEKDSQFKRIKDIPAFFVAVRVDKKKDVAENKTFPDRELLKKFGSYLEVKKYEPKTVRAYVGSVQALFKYYEIPITTSYSDLPPATITNPKYTWSIQQVGKFLHSFDSPLYYCLGVWFLQSGLSNIDLLQLTYSKVKQQYESDVNPFCLNMVRWKTRKFQIKFRTFIGTQGIEAFREYYESLPNALSDNDRVFPISSVAIQKYFVRRSREFLATAQPKADLAKPEKKLRNPCVPSSLRTAFRTFLTDAKVTDSVIEYLMGHNLTGDLGKTYLNRSDDSWRVVWKETAEPYLTFPES